MDIIGEGINRILHTSLSGILAERSLLVFIYYCMMHSAIIGLRSIYQLLVILSWTENRLSHTRGDLWTPQTINYYGRVNTKYIFLIYTKIPRESSSKVRPFPISGLYNEETDAWRVSEYVCSCEKLSPSKFTPSTTIRGNGPFFLVRKWLLIDLQLKIPLSSQEKVGHFLRLRISRSKPPRCEKYGCKFWKKFLPFLERNKQIFSPRKFENTFFCFVDNSVFEVNWYFFTSVFSRIRITRRRN